MRKLTAVVADADRTFIAFTDALGSVDPPALAAEVGHRIFAFRGRASLFGWNAPHPNVLAKETRALYGIVDGHDWTFDIEPSRVILDGVQDGWVAGSLVALTRPGDVELYVIAASVDDGVAKYAVSGRATRLDLDSNENLATFAADYRRVSAYGKSEELAFAETPIVDAVFGDVLELGGLVDLAEGRQLVVRGRLAQALVRDAGLELVEGGEAHVLDLGARVTLTAAPRQLGPGSATFEWRLRAPGGFEGVVSAPLASFAFVEAQATAEIAAETAVLASVSLADPTHAELNLQDPLKRAYDRATARIHANVAPATHGETTQEILGDGDAGRAFQGFQLKQAPLTYVSAATETGAASTLELRVNDVLWAEAPTLYGRAARERVFETRTTDEGATIVQFGDGMSGARPPSGRNNIVARYRKGIGRAGSVKAGALTTALDRPLGLREVFNPLAAAGGEDPETDAGARENAPVTTLTLGRVVSLRNYEDFARGFAGISKAKADWAWDGETRRHPGHRGRAGRRGRRSLHGRPLRQPRARAPHAGRSVRPQHGGVLPTGDLQAEAEGADRRGLPRGPGPGRRRGGAAGRLQPGAARVRAAVVVERDLRHRPFRAGRRRPPTSTFSTGPHHRTPSRSCMTGSWPSRRC